MSLINLLLLATLSYISLSNDICDVEAEAQLCTATEEQCSYKQLCSKRTSIKTWQALKPDEVCEAPCKCYCLNIATNTESTTTTTTTSSTNTDKNDNVWKNVYESMRKNDESHVANEEKMLIRNVWIMIMLILLVNIIILFTCGWWKKRDENEAYNVTSTRINDVPCANNNCAIDEEPKQVYVVDSDSHSV
eukprot:445338_1